MSDAQPNSTLTVASGSVASPLEAHLIDTAEPMHAGALSTLASAAATLRATLAADPATLARTVAVGRSLKVPTPQVSPTALALSLPLQIATAVLGLFGRSSVADGPPVPVTPAPFLDLALAAFRRIESLVVNQLPTAHQTRTDQSPDGVITGGLNAVDPDGDPLTYHLSTNPTHGTASINADGSYTYTPDPIYAHSLTADGASTPAPDIFTVTVDDSRGFHLFSPGGQTVAVPVAVTVTPVNHAPVVQSNAMHNADGTTTISVTTADGDADTVTTSAVATGGHGTLTAVTGGYAYTPDVLHAHGLTIGGAATAGTDTVTISATDGHGGTAASTSVVTIDPVNHAPTLTAAATGDHTTNTTNITVITADTDTPSHPDTLSVSVSTAPSHGSLTPNPATGGYTYAPETGYTGTDSVAFTVSDGHGGQTQHTVNINPTNHAPTLQTVPTTNADGTTTITVTVDDVDADIVTTTAFSPDGDGTLTTTSSGFVYTPESSSTHSTDSVTITATDTYGATSSSTVNVSAIPTANAPTPGVPDPKTGAVTGSISVDNPGGFPLTYSITGAPSMGSVTLDGAANYTYTPTVTARLTAGAGTAPVTDHFTIAADDGHGGVTTVTVTPTVSPAQFGISDVIPIAGGSPFGQALSPDGHYLYLANPASGTLTVVDTRTRTVTATIPAGTYPELVTTNPDGSRAYVLNVDPQTLTGSITVIDTVAGTMIGSPIVVGGLPTALAAKTDGSRLYVTTLDPQTAAGSVIVMDTDTGTMIGAPIAVGAVPYGIAVSPDGTRAYVVNAGSRTVSVIDTSTNTVVGTPIAVGSTPYGIAVSPDGTRAYVVNAGGGTVSVIDTSTNTVVGTPIAVGSTPYGIAVSPDGTLVYVTNVRGGTLSVVDTSTNTVVGTPIAVGSTPYGIAVSPDGTHVYVTNVGDGTVSVLEIAPVTAPIAGTPTVTRVDLATGTVAGTLGFRDPRGNTLAYTVTAPPTQGAVTIGADGTYAYTPTDQARDDAAAADGSLVDTFTVSADDGGGGTADVLVTVIIKPTNHAPVLGSPAFIVQSTDFPSGQVDGFITADDPDGDSLTYTLAANVDPEIGSVVVDEHSGMWTFSPTDQARLRAYQEGEAAAVTFDVITSDGQFSTTATVVVPISPQAPVSYLDTGTERFPQVFVSPDGRVYVVGQNVTVYEPDDTISATYDYAGPAGMDRNGDLYVAQLAASNPGGYDDTILITRIASIGSVATIPITIDGYNELLDGQMAVSPDGHIYMQTLGHAADDPYAEWTTNFLTVVNPDGSYENLPRNWEVTNLVVGPDGMLYGNHLSYEPGHTSPSDPVVSYLLTIDPDTAQVVDKVDYSYQYYPVLGAPTFGPDGRIYIASSPNSMYGTITVINPDHSIQTISSFPQVGSLGPLETEAIAFGPDGRLYVASTHFVNEAHRSFGGTVITALDPDNDFAPTTIASDDNEGPGGRFLTTSPDGRIFYATSTDGLATQLMIVGTNTLTNPTPTTLAPTSTSALYDHLLQVSDNYDGVYVEKVIDSDHTVRLIVYIGGTTSELSGSDQSKLENIPAAIGVLDEDVTDALDKAVAANPDAKIMLVGYSQGGIDAQNVAASGRYANLTTLVTFGTAVTVSPAGALPDGRVQLPAGLHVAHIIDRNDPVSYDFSFAAPLQYSEDKGMVFFGLGGVTPADTSAAANQPLHIGYWNVHENPVTYETLGASFDQSSDPRFADVQSDLHDFQGTVVQTWT